MASSWGEQVAALSFRDWARNFIADETAKNRPRYRYATVVEIDRADRKCTVNFTGETADTVVSTGSIQPAYIGQIVRVAGVLGDRYIEDVLGPSVSIDETNLAYWRFSTVTTMADPGNGYFRLNNATVSSVTAIALKHIDASDTDVLRILHMTAASSTNTFFTISKAADPTKVAIYKATANTDNTSWDSVTCAHVYSTVSSFTLDDYFRIHLSPAIP